MVIETLTVGPLQTACYLIADDTSGEGVLIDPGGDARRIVGAADGYAIRYVINTHAHFDHTMANGSVLAALGRRQTLTPELVAHAQAAPLLAAGGGARLFGFQLPPSPEPDRLVDDGDVLTVGGLALKVMHTPGHSPGSISLYCAAESVVFAGDVLFRRGVGRADLEGGNWGTLMETIRERLFTLPDDTIVYPGHGPPTTIGEERRENPFLV